MGVARGAVDAGAPPGRKIIFGADFMWVRGKCIPEGDSAPPSEERRYIFIGRRRVWRLIEAAASIPQQPWRNRSPPLSLSSPPFFLASCPFNRSS